MRYFPMHLVLLLAIGGNGQSLAGADEKTPSKQKSDRPVNIRTKTLGGKQFWTDQLVFHDWRIQRNMLTGHCRLLDPADHREAWGTFEACRRKLDSTKEKKKLPPMRGKAVIVLHGLFRSRSSMNKLAKFLQDEGKYTVANVGYASTRGSVGDHAKALASVISRLDEVDEINFVAHSLGNLVIRHYLADHTDAKNGRKPDPRIKRIVMLGPPNHGAELAEKLIPIDISGQIVGSAAKQIANDWDQLAKQLATPGCQFGIIAGGKQDGSGRNPLVSGDDDLIVSVASTRLVGARDFRVLPVWHTTMMNDKTVREDALRFLQQGHFESDEKRQPIESDE